jgi:hypothetical protein
MSSSLTSARYILTVALLRTTLDEASGPRSLRAKNTMCVCVCVCVCVCACVCVCLSVREGDTGGHEVLHSHTTSCSPNSSTTYASRIFMRAPLPSESLPAASSFGLWVAQGCVSVCTSTEMGSVTTMPRYPKVSCKKNCRHMRVPA